MTRFLILTVASLLWTSTAFSSSSSDAELIKRRSQEFSGVAKTATM